MERELGLVYCLIFLYSIHFSLLKYFENMENFCCSFIFHVPDLETSKSPTVGGKKLCLLIIVSCY